MNNSKKNIVKIKPKFVKDTKGKITQVYLDLKEYNSILSKLKEFESFKKINKI